MVAFAALEPLLLRGLLIAGLCIAAAVAWHQFTGHYEAIGAARVQTKWDADKAMRVKRASDLAELYAARVQADAEQARKDKEKDDAKYASLQDQLAALSPVPSLHFSAGAISLWNAATVFANGSADPAAVARPARGAAPVPKPADTNSGATISEQTFDAYQLKATAAYREAVRMFHDVRARYEHLRTAKLPEVTP